MLLNSIKHRNGDRSGQGGNFSCHQFIIWKWNKKKNQKQNNRKTPRHQKGNKVSSSESALRNPNTDLLRPILQKFRVMPTKEKAWPGKKCTSQTLTDLTSQPWWKGLIMVWISYSCFANQKMGSITRKSPPCRNMPQHWCVCYIPSTDLEFTCISILPEWPQTQHLLSKVFSWFSESRIGSILLPSSDHTSSILRSAFIILSLFFPIHNTQFNEFHSLSRSEPLAELEDTLQRPRYHTLSQVLPKSWLRMPSVHHPASKGKLQFV